MPTFFDSMEFVRWVSESYRPFAVATDPPLLRLLKNGRPNFFVPSPRMISRDAKIVFAVRRKKLSDMLVAYAGRLHFGTDCWSSPNHRAFIAFTVHLELRGRWLSMLLDIVELAKSHSGANLATAFADMLVDWACKTR
ncbi:hypothetical protein K466DRAFT_607906 [Polyporus arcularius HHB13444]|uniref:HAT C-terminal dimerisation domain-containing protein n=1 Tax=Polyporus arcularius HHB13444 TaxID=1314778 RepID=A0A5C3NKB7_9APHY|nr:hypothetical protein K466DRAFT_607906 [Polyporus arcularius HHB13444]